MDGGGDASQTVNSEPGSLCSSTLISPNLTGLLITGQVTAPVVVRLPQDRPAFLQSRYEDRGQPNQHSCWAQSQNRSARAVPRMALLTRASTSAASGNTSSTWPTCHPRSIRNHCRSRKPERAHRYSNSNASPDPAVIQLVGAFRFSLARVQLAEAANHRSELCTG